MRLIDRCRNWIDRLRPPKPLGIRGERAAQRHLKRLGYKIVGRQVHIAGGEIDLVAVDGRTVVFVEVKTRQSDDAGRPEEAVTPGKQRQLTRLALAYLRRHDLLECSSRFDVVAIIWPENARRPTIEHFKNAFEATGTGQMFS